MQHLADLLSTIPLPELPAVESAENDAAPPGAPCADPTALLAGHSLCGSDLVEDLGAGLPEGHLHVWGGPDGAGKTSFLLCLLQGAASRGRRVVYATYDLSPESLALRLLAMTAGVERRALPDPGGTADGCRLAPDELARAHAARDYLATLPFEIQRARGFSAASLCDRVARMPYRACILAVDYLQGVICEPGSEMGLVLRQLADLAAHLHVAVVCAVRAGDETAAELDEMRARGLSLPDRVGWIAPLEKTAKAGAESPGSVTPGSVTPGSVIPGSVTPGSVTPGSVIPGSVIPGSVTPGSEVPGDGDRCAEVLHNRHGDTTSVPLHLDEATGSLGRARPFARPERRLR